MMQRDIKWKENSFIVWFSNFAEHKSNILGNFQSFQLPDTISLNLINGIDNIIKKETKRTETGENMEHKNVKNDEPRTCVDHKIIM